jgi:hypothetical protein
MKLTNKFVNSNTNKTAETVIKLVEYLMDHGHTLWIDNFYNSPELTCLLKSKETDGVRTLRVNRKNVLPFMKEKRKTKLKKEEQFGQYSWDAEVLNWHNKKSVTMISTYHTDEMQVSVSRGKEIIKHVVMSDYSSHMKGGSTG